MSYNPYDKYKLSAIKDDPVIRISKEIMAKRMPIKLNPSHSISYIITEEVSNPQKLVLKANGEIDIKIMVGNVEIGEDRYTRIGSRSHNFDLSEHTGKFSVAASITNLSPYEVIVNSYLLSDGQVIIDTNDDSINYSNWTLDQCIDFAKYMIKHNIDYPE